MVTDEAGSVVWTERFRPFGDEEAQSGSLANDFRFTGKHFDQEADLYYFNARHVHRSWSIAVSEGGWYDSSMGRFISEDPLWGNIRDPQSLNRFAYGRNNPFKYTDPTGKFVFCATAALGYVGYTGVMALADLAIMGYATWAAQNTIETLKTRSTQIQSANTNRSKTTRVGGNYVGQPEGPHTKKGDQEHVHWGPKGNERGNALNKDGTVRHGKEPPRKVREAIEEKMKESEQNAENGEDGADDKGQESDGQDDSPSEKNGSE